MAEPLVLESPAPSVIRRRRLVPSFAGNWAIWISGSVIAFLVLVAIFAPLLAPHDPNEIELSNTLQGSSSEHLLGTDGSGRDILSRLIYATRLSLAGPALVVLLSALIGALTGLSGMYLSYYIDIASGATIVLLQATLFGGVLAVTSLQKRAAHRLLHTHV